MTKGLNSTFNHLLRTRNDAALEVLIAGLESHWPTIRERAINCLARRRQPAGHNELLLRLNTLGEHDLAQLGTLEHRMHASLEEALLGDDGLLCENAGRLALILREFELFPALIAATEGDERPTTPKVAATLVRLALLLREQSDLPAHQRTKRDPFFARRKAVEGLSKSLDQFHRHKRLEILDAFLLLTSHDHPALKKLLENPNHPCYDQLISALRTSPTPGIIRLLAEFMHDTQTPLELIKLFAERTDPKFLSASLAAVGVPVSLRVLQNMAKLTRVAWVEEDRDVLFKLTGPEQAVAVELATASGIERPRVFNFLCEMMGKGAPESRRACCEALDEFRTPQADALMQQALQDEDSGVQAAATAQIKRRGLPGALPKLLRMIESDAEEVREAARGSLTEYTFTKFVSEYAEMDELKKRSRGEIVGKCDPKVADGLRRELKSPSPTLRLQATEMVHHLRLVDAVAEALVERMLDAKENLEVRVGAAQALAASRKQESRDALRKSMGDSEISLRDAARQSLATFRPVPLTASFNNRLNNQLNIDTPGVTTP